MIRSLAARLFLMGCLAFFLMGSVLPDSKYKTPVGNSRWRIGRTGIVANIDLNENLFSDMRGLKERRYNFASGSQEELQRIAGEFLQGYVDQKVQVWLNGKKCLLKVDRLERLDNSIYTIWISIDDIQLKSTKNILKINYNMLFEEIDNQHLNQALYYFSNATGDALRRMFDYSPAVGEHDFIASSKSWELSFDGRDVPALEKTRVSGNVAAKAK
ncbi:hypothetical protein [Geomesophilobacter sediminis]|uniref:Uncharacterized protein n=1 Tax=Geomesophilobacter sediminis TaxID=2798584 RepID=A0A8J7JIF5_9BACT|nr:hypothetical protein [Geomesophilobacter sediminis]MBJ6724230.1 hypothetical protein [Geomesophilobacter sediminis]